MRRTYERGTKARFSFSGGRHALVNIADSMEELNVGETKNSKLHVRYISYAKFSQIVEVLRDFHPETVQLPAFSILSAISPVRDAKPRFDAALERSAHDCETRLLPIIQMLYTHAFHVRVRQINFAYFRPTLETLHAWLPC